MPPARVASPAQYQWFWSRGGITAVGFSVVPAWIVESRPLRSMAKELFRKTVVPPSSTTGGRLPSGLILPRKGSEKTHTSFPLGSFSEYVPSAPVQSSRRLLSLPYAVNRLVSLASTDAPRTVGPHVARVVACCVVAAETDGTGLGGAASACWGTAARLSNPMARG